MSRHRAPSIDQIAAARAQRTLLRKLKRPVPPDVEEMANATPQDEADDPAHPQRPEPKQLTAAPAPSSHERTVRYEDGPGVYDVFAVPAMDAPAEERPPPAHSRAAVREPPVPTATGASGPPSVNPEMNPETDEYREPESLHESLRYLEHLLGEALAIVDDEDPERDNDAAEPLRVYLAAISSIFMKYWSVLDVERMRQLRQLAELHAQGVLSDEEYVQEETKVREDKGSPSGDNLRDVVADLLLQEAQDWEGNALISRRELEAIQGHVRGLASAPAVIRYHRDLQAAMFSRDGEEAERTITLPAMAEPEAAESSPGHW